METILFLAFIVLMACHPLAVIALHSSRSQEAECPSTEVSAVTLGEALHRTVTHKA